MKILPQFWLMPKDILGGGFVDHSKKSEEVEGTKDWWCFYFTLPNSKDWWCYMYQGVL